MAFNADEYLIRYGIKSQGLGYDDYLCHHGIKGQKWGVRRYQNEDGSLTPAGKVRYLSDVVKGKAAEWRERRKRSAVAKGNAKKIMKYADSMTTSELNDAVNRAAVMKRLNELVPQKESFLKRASDMAGRFSSYGEKFLSLGNTMKRIRDFNKEEPDPEEKADRDQYMKSLRTDLNKKANKIREEKGEEAAADFYEKGIKSAKKEYMNSEERRRKKKEADKRVWSNRKDKTLKALINYKYDDTANAGSSTRSTWDSDNSYRNRRGLGSLKGRGYGYERKKKVKSSRW